MSKFQIVFDKKLIYRSKKGAITAPLYIDWGNFQFPEKGWSDFVVVVLAWWMEAFWRLVGSQKKQVEFSFMDGPMLLRLCPIENDMVTVLCVNQRSLQEIVEYEETISLLELASQLTSTSLEVLRICEENGWESKDIRRLKEETKRLVTSH